MEDGSRNAGLDMAGAAADNTTTFIGRTYICRGCGKVRTFLGPSEKMVGQQIASAGWKVDGPRGDCPSCWMLYEAGIVRAARGNI